MTETTESSGEFLNKADAVESAGGDVAYWKKEIDLSGEREKDWRSRAEESESLYRSHDGKKSEDNDNSPRYNIHHSNIETIVPAIYNAAPIPDIRRRFNDDDADARTVSQVLERCVSYFLDKFNVDDTIDSAVQDSEIVGRGLARIRYEPTITQQPVTNPLTGEAIIDPATGQPMLQEIISDQVVYPEIVIWNKFRHGPARHWKDVPWIAYHHLMNKDQVAKLNPELADKIPYNYRMDGTKLSEDQQKGDEPPSLFRRAEVWEILDKETKKLIFTCFDYLDSHILETDPPIKFSNFFSSPPPLYPIKLSKSLTPIEPLRHYNRLQEDLNKLMDRIAKVRSVIKARGLYSKEFKNIDSLESADDGEMIPIEGVFQNLQESGGFDKAIWMWPIDKLAQVLTILENQIPIIEDKIGKITGMADIMRGASNPNETLGAQQLKAQWGSMRVNRKQRRVQSFAREIVRMMVECIAENFEKNIIERIAGMALSDQQYQLMKDEVLLSYRIDIESDSTIRSDVGQAQQNISGFISGFGSFVQSVGPAIQSGFMPMNVAMEMALSFSRVFKLGRQVEEAFDGMKQQYETQQKQQQLMAAQGMQQGGPPMQGGAMPPQQAMPQGNAAQPPQGQQFIQG